MTTLKDFFKINNISYSELSEIDKQKLEKFIQLVKVDGLEDLILQFNHEKYKWDVSDNKETNFNREFTSSLPEDLAIKLNFIWAKNF